MRKWNVGIEGKQGQLALAENSGPGLLLIAQCAGEGGFLWLCGAVQGPGPFVQACWLQRPRGGAGTRMQGSAEGLAYESSFSGPPWVGLGWL